MKTKKWNKELYKRIAVIALPIILQNLLDAAVQSADVLMLNFVGQTAISAVSLASQYGSIIFMCLFGIGTGVSMLGAQYWGKGDTKTIEKVEGLGLRFSLGIAIVAAVSCLLIPGYMMKLYTNDPELIRLGIVYLRIFAPSMILWSICAIYTAILRCIGKVSTSTMIEAIALISNVLLNAVFIFGLFGLPKLGVTGVALATTMSRMIQLVCCLVVSARNKNVKLRIRPIFEKHPALFRDYVSMVLPAIGNDVIWSVGFSMYSVILGHLGNDAVAANSIVSVVRNLGCVLCFGIGNAAGIILGQMLGENKIEEAKKASHTLLRLTIGAGILGGIFVLALTPFVMNYAKLSETALDYLLFMLRVNVYYITGTAVNTILIAGVFRAGGDSKFGFLCDTIDMWIYAVPLGFLAAFALHLPVKVVYFLLCTDEFVKWPWVFKHYYSYKWAKNITRENIDG
ncbi:MAG: MATE family efflux transporter [Lachnospiraceae bacterium]|nr:MATE family efflux transporter [Lachnospiraceae bacterium]